jgi:uncharacterized protein GlcG (DUF336 family)
MALNLDHGSLHSDLIAFGHKMVDIHQQKRKQELIMNITFMKKSFMKSIFVKPMFVESRLIHAGIINKSILGWFVLVMAGQALADEIPFVQTRTLSATLANQAMLAAYSECSKRGFHVAVALTSRDGQLQAFLRSPLAGPHTVQVSQRKAYTAATYQSSTLSMREREELKFSPGVLLLGGGLPISIGGHFYGAIAVSGAPAEKITGDVDQQCAQSGIDAIREVLEFSE